MNKYGQVAMKHWAKWLPQRYAQISDPPTFFNDLGQQIEDQVTDLTQTRDQQQTPATNYLDRVGQLNMTRKVAEEQILADLAYLPPENPDQDDPTPMQEPGNPRVDHQGMPTDRSHPVWEAEHDPQVSVQEYQTILAQWRKDSGQHH